MNNIYDKAIEAVGFLENLSAQAPAPRAVHARAQEAAKLLNALLVELRAGAAGTASLAGKSESVPVVGER